MNVLSLAEFGERLAHRLRFRVRMFDPRRHAAVFSRGDEPDAIQRIYVINLDRKPDRWRRQRQELDRFRGRHGERLSTIARRFSAIDARYLREDPCSSTLIPRFTLADQLTVDPNPLLKIDDSAHGHEIKMTRQEIAVALSHIEVWKLIANGGVPSALVLEDDVFFPIGFARNLDATWSELVSNESGSPGFDLLYLSFKEVGEPTQIVGRGPQQRTRPGIWQASGYVLTREGAQELLALLPVHGPVDLWLNLQFGNLKVFTAARCIIEQSIDEPSTNSYSVLPVLSQVGVITREKPLVPTTKRLPGPVIVIGNKDDGLTALAKALSMLGYTCCSDLDRLPTAEQEKLLAGRRGRLFNAYVNIGSIDNDAVVAIITSSSSARLIVTSSDYELPKAHPDRVLHLTSDVADKWGALTEFFGLEYPSFPYPADVDLGQRPTVEGRTAVHSLGSKNLMADKSPWILRSTRPGWSGLSLESDPTLAQRKTGVDWASGESMDPAVWMLRRDTFPSNLALFTPSNFSEEASGQARLTLRPEASTVRELTSAAIASKQSHLYGAFRAELKPSAVSGLITGLFLHRNGPRQEIDIEFLGRDTTKMLVNVYYNPGPDSTKLEYGYRGTPTLIDLGFDAADSFHAYEIDWQPNAIRWIVDGKVVYERLVWDPTPIPDQPLEFNINLWHSRSTEFAGQLSPTALPATVELRSIDIRGV